MEQAQGKKRILIIYEVFVTGGSTTSLLNLLREFDYDRYDIDLVTYRSDNSELLREIPKSVRILKDAVIYGKSRIDRLKKAVLLLPSHHFHRAMRARRKRKNKYVVLQNMGYAKVRLCRKIPGIYHAAIAFIEGWSISYLISDKVKANKKIAFIHLDYATAGVDANIDRRAFGILDALVTVSESCKTSLARLYPEYSEKITCIENLHSPERIRELSHIEPEIPDVPRLDFITVCRPDIYVKGLDRLLDAAVILRDSGYKFRWGVLGVGEDERFLRMLNEHSLDGTVIPYRAVKNPYPIMLRADWLVITSRTEAKPMTVTEAQILCIPCIATEYSSAREQIRNGVDGIITENSTEALVAALKTALSYPDALNDYRRELQNKSFDFSRETKKLYSLMDSKPQ